MIGYKQKGEVISYGTGETYTIDGTSDEYNEGQILKIGNGPLVGYIVSPLKSDGTRNVAISNVYEVAKTDGEAISTGTAVYYDTTTKLATTTSTNNLYIGIASADALSSDTTVDVLLNVGVAQTVGE